VPVTALHPLPDVVDEVAGALVEPGGSALRSLWGTALRPGERVLVLGPGTIGLLVALFALAHGAEVHMLGLSRESLDLTRPPRGGARPGRARQAGGLHRRGPQVGAPGWSLAGWQHGE
jgi:hypothetical protein